MHLVLGPRSSKSSVAGPTTLARIPATGTMVPVEENSRHFDPKAELGPGAPRTSARMHPVTLRFTGELEAEFQKEYAARTLVHLRGGLLLGVLLYTAFGILDVWIAPLHRQTLWLIRYAVVAPLLIVTILFTYHPSFEKHREAIVATVVLIAVLGIVAMTAIILPPGNYLYYAGLILALMYTFTLVRLSIPVSLGISVITTVAYVVVAFYVSRTPPALITNNLFFLVSTIVIGFSANYTMAKYARTNFLQRRLIESHTAELEEKNAELLVRNQMLVESRAETVSTARRSELIFAALSETLPGTVLDEKYRLSEKIGAGNFGTVYRGEHIFLHQPVAVKVFRPAVGHLALESLDRFRVEGISACRVNHPNAVTVFDFDISAGLAYLVMELLRGRSLADELRDKGKLSCILCAQIAACICDVLAEAHSAGILHRDIKPSNVFLHDAQTRQTVKVIDFGIAKLTDTAASAQAGASTVAGLLIGTPAYIAPERLLEEPYDGRSDVYAVGILMYEALAGRLPFEPADHSYWSLAKMHITEEPPPLRSVGVEVPRELETIVLEALTKSKETRPTAQKMGQMLHEFISRQPAGASPA